MFVWVGSGVGGGMVVGLGLRLSCIVLSFVNYLMLVFLFTDWLGYILTILLTGSEINCDQEK